MGDVFHSWALAREAARARWTSGAIVAARSARRYSSCVACHTCVRSCGCPCNAGSPQHSLRAAPWPVSTSLRAQRSRCRCLSAAAVIQLTSAERRLLSAQAPHQHSREERRRIRHVRPLRRARWVGQRVRSVTTTGRSQSRRPWDRTRHPLPGERRGGVSASERSTVERASQCASEPSTRCEQGRWDPAAPLFLRVFEAVDSSPHEHARPNPLGHRPVAPCGAAGSARGALRAPRAPPAPPRPPPPDDY